MDSYYNIPKHYTVIAKGDGRVSNHYFHTKYKYYLINIEHSNLTNITLLNTKLRPMN